MAKTPKSDESKSNKPNKASLSMAPRQARGKPTTMEDLLAQSGYNIPSLKRGQEVTGKIVSVSRGEILIDIKAKSEGIVAGRELESVRDLASKLSVGDQIEATVIYPENDAGQVVLSLRKLSQDKRWSELEEIYSSGEDLEVTALEVNRGGIICDFAQIRGFLPASQLTKPPAKLADLIGKNLTVRVIEVDRNTNRLIFSQKQPAKSDLEVLKKILAKVELGQVVKGEISAILPFGIFVEVSLGEVTKVTKEPKAKETSDSSGSSVTLETSKLEGLVHISEISWDKVDDPSKLYKVGQKVEVKVVGKDETTGRLSLSMKQLQEDPFVKTSEKFTKDQTVKGTVSRITPYGVVAALEGGIEGLIHISKIPPNVTYEIGNSIECTVEDIDTKSRKVSLVPVVTEKPILYR